MNRKVNIEELFLQYYRPLCLYALRLLSDLDRAEDVMQDSFVKILERPASISHLPERQVAAYLFRIVRNRCVDELRRDGQQTVLSLESSGAWHLRAYRGTPGVKGTPSVAFYGQRFLSSVVVSVVPR